MRRKRFLQFSSWGLVVLSCLFSLQVVRADQDRHRGVEVNLRTATLQDILDQLFGTGTTPGLLNGNQPFELRAENVMLTPQQAQNFFFPTTPATMDFATIVADVEKIPGAELKIEGVLNGAPFELKIERGEVKVEGLVLTQDQLNALVNQLQATAGVREVKVEALVNGKLVEVKIENGEEKIEHARHRGERHGRQEARGRDRNDKAEHAHDAEHMRHHDRVERVERVDRHDRPERPERPERMGGPGRD